MKKLLLALAVPFAACGAPPASRLAPDFSLRAATGEAVTLSSFRGRPVLVNFWATWCDSCKEEMPALEAMHRRLSPKGAVLLGLSMDDDAAKAIPPFARAHGLTFALLDAGRETPAAYAVRSLPATFLVDAEGLIVRRWAGPMDLRAVENDILAQLNRRP